MASRFLLMSRCRANEGWCFPVAGALPGCPAQIIAPSQWMIRYSASSKTGSFPRVIKAVHLSRNLEIKRPPALACVAQAAINFGANNNESAGARRVREISCACAGHGTRTPPPKCVCQFRLDEKSAPDAPDALGSGCAALLHGSASSVMKRA